MICGFHRGVSLAALILRFRSPLLKKPIQIIPLEPESATVAELRGRDRALPRPAADRLLVHAKHAARSEAPSTALLVNVTNVDERFSATGASVTRLRSRMIGRARPQTAP